MPKTFVLITAINHYSESFYGPGNDLHGCLIDAEKVHNLLTPIIDVYEVLFDSECTKAEILNTLKWFADNMEPNDRLIWYHSGHGSYQDTPKGRATCRCMHDDILWDSELIKIWKQFKPGCKIVTLSDSCFSESNSRLIGIHGTKKSLVLQRKATKIPTKGRVPAAIALVDISACTVEQVAYEVETGGVFTSALIDAFRSIHVGSLTWNTWFEGIEGNIDADFPQNPVLEYNAKGKKMLNEHVV